MSSETKVMSQKEYLKKYLSNEKDKKKKKKVKLSSSSVLKRSQIIDDDVDLKSMRLLNDDEIDLYQLDEDAPQIAGIIDERPPEQQAMEYYGDKKRWKVFGGEDGDGQIHVKDKYQTITSERPLSNVDIKGDKSVLDARGSNSSGGKLEKGVIRGRDDDSDLSTPRESTTSHKHSRNDYKASLGRKSKKQDSDSDFSPDRRPKESKSHPHKKTRRKSSDSDQSPPRRKSKTDHSSVRRSQSDSDLSPPRSSQKMSIRRENDSDSDFSPPRLTKTENSHHVGSKRSSGKEKSYLKSSGDVRDNRTYFDSKNGDRSDKYKSKHDKHSRDKFMDRDKRDKAQKLGSSDSKKSEKKMEKTLDGRRAGLQNASQLRKELKDFKNKEDSAFSQLASDMSGVNAAPVIRDRKTGMIRDLQQEQRVAEEKAAKAAVQTEKYSRWGRGVKQSEDAAERVADAIHEMSKPLARYANDDDLDRMLKAQEREGDPMLDYIRRKQSEATPLKDAKPVYQGTFLPNRYGIRPGYRWDGVDRSNGFEKQWFSTKNNRKARDEEAYKWSTSDM